MQDLLSGTDNPTIPPARPGADADFEQFWTEYPRKEAKMDAQKAWGQTLMARPAQSVLMARLASLKTGLWKDREKKFWPLAGTWLRGRRWEDAGEAQKTGATTAPPVPEVCEYGPCKRVWTVETCGKRTCAEHMDLIWSSKASAEDWKPRPKPA